MSQATRALTRRGRGNGLPASAPVALPAAWLAVREPKRSCGKEKILNQKNPRSSCGICFLFSPTSFFQKADMRGG
jgi:hypothetical protein